MGNVAYSLGCDPEVFVVDGKGNYISAHDLVPGTKHMPTRVPFGAIQPDGTAAEFNIDPAYTAEDFTQSIRKVLEALRDHIQLQSKSYRLKVVPTAWFNKTYFNTLPATAKAFGCEPDFDSYTGKMNIFKPTKEPFRTGAGHLHIGWSEGEDINDTAHLFDCQEMVKQMDAVLYPLSLLWDPDEQRRRLYGKIGSFRPKSYGVEYRPLSNVWVADPKLHTWLFETTTQLCEILDTAGMKVFKHELYTEFLDKYESATKTKLALTKMELVKYHDAITDRFNLPTLPEVYLR